MSSIINTGISALTAFKRQMETTGHNIANVNTEGYSRQRVDFATRTPQIAGQGFIGSGVQISSIQRSYDEHLAKRVRDYNASHQEFLVFNQRASQIDDVLADASAGLDNMLQQFFAGVNDVADDPTSIPARSVMINRADQLSDRFNALNTWLEDIRQQLNRDMNREVGEINSLAQSLAEVNARIGTYNGASGGIPNDVLDERDKLVDELSRYSNVTTVEQGDGAMNVFIGTGQAIVVGNNYSTLAVVNSTTAPDYKEIELRQSGGSAVTVTSQMTGGSLGGMLRFRDEVLDESQNALGRVAIGLGSFFNAEHRTGMDLDGDFGGDFFAVAAPETLSSPGNVSTVTAGSVSGTVTVALDDASALTTHDYQLQYDGASWSLTDLDTGSAVAMSGLGTSASPYVAAGISIVIDTTPPLPAPAAGDSFLIRPTRAGASAIATLVRDERDIAAGEAVRTGTITSNTGTGRISAGAQTSSAGTTKLTTPLTLEFNAGAGQFDVYSGSPPVGPALGSVAYNPLTDSGSTRTVSIAGLGDYSFTITGTPDDTDRFTLSDNTGAVVGTSVGVGDNRNARRLADLQTSSLMIGGTATFANTYGALIADVGTKTQQAENNATVQQHLLGQAESAKSEVSGVNLDEEAADLVRFQQAYQAAAQVINVANTLFDSLLGAVRR
jgi:flagellar hook-associated protein 1 FlgK